MSFSLCYDYSQTFLEMKRFILISGFGKSGSSAVGDRLAEYAGISRVPREFKILSRSGIYRILSATDKIRMFIAALKGIKRLAMNRLKWPITRFAPRAISNKTERLHFLDLLTLVYLFAFISALPFMKRGSVVAYWKKYLNVVISRLAANEIVILDQPAVLFLSRSSLDIFDDYVSVVVHRNVKDQVYEHLSRTGMFDEKSITITIESVQNKIERLQGCSLFSHEFVDYDSFVRDPRIADEIILNKFACLKLDSVIKQKRFIQTQALEKIGIGEQLDKYLSFSEKQKLLEVERLRLQAFCNNVSELDTN